MSRRYTLEKDRPDGFLADSYLAVAICSPVLIIVFAMMIAYKSPLTHVAIVVAVGGAVVSLATYLADLQFRVTLLLGEDGIVVFGSRENLIFVSHAAIQNIEVQSNGFVAIQRSDGSTLVFRALPTLPLRGRNQNAQRIVAAIDDERDLYRAAAKVAVSEPLLHRSGREALDFVRDLKTLTHARVQTYRSAPFDRDRLWRIAENRSTSSKDRIASFIALRVEASEADMTRLREMKDRVVDERTAQRLSRAMTLTQDEELVDLLELREEDEAARSLPERLRRRRAI